MLHAFYDLGWEISLIVTTRQHSDGTATIAFYWGRAITNTLIIAVMCRPKFTK